MGVVMKVSIFVVDDDNDIVINRTFQNESSSGTTDQPNLHVPTREESDAADTPNQEEGKYEHTAINDTKQSRPYIIYIMYVYPIL